MIGLRATVLARLGAALVAATVLLAMASPAIAAKPPPKPETLKATATTAGFSAILRYQVDASAGQIVGTSCTLHEPDGGTTTGCDLEPDKGSGAKLTKFSIGYSTPNAGGYTAAVSMDLTGGLHLDASTGFTILPGPAVRLAVTGLVPQELICYQGIDCVGYPPADFPHQVARITALDVNGNVATGYAGTVSFVDPVQGHAPGGLADQTLTNGVGYVPVRIPDLPYAFVQPPYSTHCPGGNIALVATDTVDPTIQGCQSLPGGSITVKLAQGFLDAISGPCPSGCYSEPTGTITIDTNLLAPTIDIPTITQPLIIDGATIAGNYFAQPVQPTYWLVNGSAFTLDTACSQCTTSMNYLAKDVTLTVGAEITLAYNGVSTDATISDPITTASILASIRTTTTGASDPTCYSDYLHQFILATCQ